MLDTLCQCQTGKNDTGIATKALIGNIDKLSTELNYVITHLLSHKDLKGSDKVRLVRIQEQAEKVIHLKKSPPQSYLINLRKIRSSLDQVMDSFRPKIIFHYEANLEGFVGREVKHMTLVEKFPNPFGPIFSVFNQWEDLVVKVDRIIGRQFGKLNLACVGAIQQKLNELNLLFIGVYQKYALSLYPDNTGSMKDLASPEDITHVFRKHETILNRTVSEGLGSVAGAVKLEDKMAELLKSPDLSRAIVLKGLISLFFYPIT